MPVVGTVYLNGCNYQVGYDLISQSVANNTSTVKFWGRLNVTNNQISWSSGKAQVWNGVANLSTYYAKGSYTVVTDQVTLSHRSDGTYSSTLTGSLSTTFVSGTASGNFSLPAIARASQPSINTWPNNSPDFNIGETITIHMNRKSSSFTHKVVFKLNSYSYTIAASGVTDSVKFNTSTIADSIYAQIPNSNVANGTIEVTTYNGSTTIGTKSCPFAAKAVNVNPTFNAAYLDTNSTTTAITQNNQKIIRNKSTLQINATSLSAKKSATLNNIKAVINGTTYTASISGSTATFNIGTLNISSNTNAVVTLTDSRGLTATKTLTIQMLDWVTPSAIITAERENNFYNPTTVNVDASYSSLDNKNTISIKVRYKKTADSTWSAYETLQDNIPSIIQLDNNYDWNLQILLEDRIGSTTYNRIVERGIPIVFFDRIKRSVGIDCFPENNESLEVDGMVKATAGFISMVSGSVNTPTGGNNLILKRANKTTDGTPENGIVLEYGGSANWTGQLFLADNASRGVWYGGWSNGVRSPWRRLMLAEVATATLSDPITSPKDNKITLNSIISNTNKLTLSNGGIKIGSGISKVLVSGNVFVQASTTSNYLWTSIKKNNDEVSIALDNQNTYFASTSHAPRIINVAENDTIYLWKKDTSDGTLRAGANICLTVQVVE